MNLSVNDWSHIIDSLLSIAAVLMPAVAVYAAVLKKAKDQLITVLDQTPIENQSILDIAKNSQKHLAAKAIAKLVH